MQCAIGLRTLEVKPNDNMVVMGPNSIDLTMPLYAAFYLGAGIVTIDMTLGASKINLFIFV